MTYFIAWAWSPWRVNVARSGNVAIMISQTRSQKKVSLFPFRMCVRFHISGFGLLIFNENLWNAILQGVARLHSCNSVCHVQKALICLLWCRVKSCFPVESQCVIRFFPLLLLLRFAMHCISSYLHHISQEREAASFFTCMRALTLKFVRNHRNCGAELKVCSTHNFGLI